MLDAELLKGLIKALEEYSVVALATIVKTWGSTPRKAGTKMVVLPDGRTFGTVGGGCTESNVKDRARIVIDTKVPILYRLSLLGDVAADEGLACGGQMEVFIEAIMK